MKPPPPQARPHLRAPVTPRAAPDIPCVPPWRAPASGDTSLAALPDSLPSEDGNDVEATDAATLADLPDVALGEESAGPVVSKLQAPVILDNLAVVRVMDPDARNP